MAASRRGLLIGGAVVALGTHRLSERAGGAAARAAARPARWTTRAPTGSAAASANWRRADRPDDFAVDRVVIHVVQGSFRPRLQVFQDPDHGAAAHYVVRKDGHMAQTVRELDVAFHAGNRKYNERSVGIEHEGFVDEASSFTDAMYASSARLTAAICARYRIAVDRTHIIGHAEVPGHGPHRPGSALGLGPLPALVGRGRPGGREPARPGSGRGPDAPAGSD